MPEQQQSGGTSDNQQQQQQGTGGTPGQQSQQQSSPDFDTWLKAQPDNVKSLVENGTKGLKSALDSERQQRQGFEQKLRETSAKLTEKDSETKRALDELANKLQLQDQQSDFYDQAHKLGVVDLKLAYLAAQSDGLIDARGRANFEELKKLHPQLFGQAQPGPRGNAGTGTGQQPAGGLSMNDWMRRQAGAKT